MWDLPKGKIEKNEKKKEAAIREVMEECGISKPRIQSKIGKTYHTYFIGETPVLKISSWYKMIYKGTEIPVPQTEEGISEIRWVKDDELPFFINQCFHNLRDILKTRLKN